MLEFLLAIVADGAGDKSNALGIINEFHNEQNNPQTPFHSLDIKTPNGRFVRLNTIEHGAEINGNKTDAREIVQQDEKSTVKFVIYAGQNPEQLKEYQSEKGEIVRIYTTHQIPSSLLSDEELLKQIDHLAVLESDQNFKSLSKKMKEHNKEDALIPLDTIPHKLTPKLLAEEFNKKKSNIPLQFIQDEKYSSYKTVVLGGDATQPDGTIKRYTEEEARKLGEYIGKKAQNDGSFILATNGPRTGEYDENGNKLFKHREIHPTTKKDIEYSIDKVSEAFIQGLQNAGLTKEQYIFFDFKFLKKGGVDSVYKALLHMPKEQICATDNTSQQEKKSNEFYLPGDSVSMISEAVNMLPTNTQLFVTRNDAMNENHEAFIKNLFDKSLISGKICENDDGELAADYSQENQECRQHSDNASKIIFQKLWRNPCALIHASFEKSKFNTINAMSNHLIFSTILMAGQVSLFMPNAYFVKATFLSFALLYTSYLQEKSFATCSGITLRYNKENGFDHTPNFVFSSIFSSAAIPTLLVLTTGQIAMPATFIIANTLLLFSSLYAFANMHPSDETLYDKARSTCALNSLNALDPQQLSKAILEHWGETTKEMDR